MTLYSKTTYLSPLEAYMNEISLGSGVNLNQPSISTVSYSKRNYVGSPSVSRLLVPGYSNV